MFTDNEMTHEEKMKMYHQLQQELGVKVKLNGRVENADGVFYWQDNYLHRTDGPAVELRNGTKLYFIKGGQRLTAEGCGRNIRK